LLLGISSNRRWVKDVIENVSASAIAFSRGKKEVEAKKLREMILSDLDKLEVKIANAWRDFDKKEK